MGLFLFARLYARPGCEVALREAIQTVAGPTEIAGLVNCQPAPTTRRSGASASDWARRA